MVAVESTNSLFVVPQNTMISFAAASTNPETNGMRRFFGGRITGVKHIRVSDKTARCLRTTEPVMFRISTKLTEPENEPFVLLLQIYFFVGLTEATKS